MWFVKVITNNEAAENDYNLSPSRYVDITEKENYRSIPAIFAELEGIEKKASKIDAELHEIFRKMGIEK